jgi:dTDP-4-amino-4,6-dideoxygalactose transaminase
MLPISFNKPYITGSEIKYIQEAIIEGKLSGDGNFTRFCTQFFEQQFLYRKVLLTTSCTHALEMSALLMDIQEGDEVIMPSYTFVSTANAYKLRGAKVIFADSLPNHPNMDVQSVASLLTNRTKAIVAMHYGGMACDMDALQALARQHHIYLVEDAAHAIGATYRDKFLGSLGHLGALSFHDTKNIVCGEGGLLIINDAAFDGRAEMIREKGTDRKRFTRGEVDKYTWQDIGSSYLPSELLAAFLKAQLEHLDTIQMSRMRRWNQYHELLSSLTQNANYILPQIPENSKHNAHLYYIVCKSLAQRNEFIQYMKVQQVQVLFHYQALHQSPYYTQGLATMPLPNAAHFSDCLVRLPLYTEITEEQVNYICKHTLSFFGV